MKNPLTAASVQYKVFRRPTKILPRPYSQTSPTNPTMQYPTLAAILFALTTSTTAAPTSLQSRSCSVAYPEAIGFPINYSISQSAGGVDKVDDFISFNIPQSPAPYGCSIMANFPANYPITSSGNSQVYFFDSNNVQVGTTTFLPGQAATIVSATCQPNMSYRMSIGSTTDAGSVAFADIQGAGLTMTYNC